MRWCVLALLTLFAVSLLFDTPRDAEYPLAINSVIAFFSLALDRGTRLRRVGKLNAFLKSEQLEGRLQELRLSCLCNADIVLGYTLPSIIREIKRALLLFILFFYYFMHMPFNGAQHGQQLIDGGLFIIVGVSAVVILQGIVSHLLWLVNSIVDRLGYKNLPFVRAVVFQCARSALGLVIFIVSNLIAILLALLSGFFLYPNTVLNRPGFEFSITVMLIWGFLSMLLICVSVFWVLSFYFTDLEKQFDKAVSALQE
ncbi:hypothetical protein JXA32_14875 [Candidatus Sumerlaeota bacterium]|nr:hypothetical protein [Candidatus Sumerlaeota bacterium]